MASNPDEAPEMLNIPRPDVEIVQVIERHQCLPAETDRLRRRRWSLAAEQLFKSGSRDVLPVTR
jgi:hypothetical protein